MSFHKNLKYLCRVTEEATQLHLFLMSATLNIHADFLSNKYCPFLCILLTRTNHESFYWLIIFTFFLLLECFSEKVEENGKNTKKETEKEDERVCESEETWFYPVHTIFDELDFSRRPPPILGSSLIL